MRAIADGTDAYAYAKKIGRFRLIKRTEGVSSTDIVGRMLMCTRVNPRMSQVRLSVPLHLCSLMFSLFHISFCCQNKQTLEPDSVGQHAHVHAHKTAHEPGASPVAVCCYPAIVCGG